MKQGMAGAIVFPIALCVLLSGMGIGFMGMPVGGLAPGDEIVITALTPHAPIRIDGDGDLTAQNGVTGGSGTAGDPWIIENLEIDANGTGYSLYIGNVTQEFIVRNCTLFNVSVPLSSALDLFNVTVGELVNNTVNNSWSGVRLNNTSNLTIRSNNIHSNTDSGLILLNASNVNFLVTNNVTDNGIGLNITLSTLNTIYHNNFINNTNHVLDTTDTNTWHNGYPVGGNYWDDYTGVDNNHTASQDILPWDGLGDTPYYITGTQDSYPLMGPYAGQEFGPELSPPYAVSFVPLSLDIQIDTNFTIQWSKAMNWTSINISFSYTDNAMNWTSYDGTWTHDTATNTSTFTPALPLAHDTEYWVNVNITTTDTMGEPLNQDLNRTGGYWPDDVLTWNFTTIPQESTPPYALTWSPNGTGEAINSTFIIQWNETMNWTSVEEGLMYGHDTVNWFYSDSGTWAHNDTTNTSTFTPDFLEWDVEYGVMINSSASDLAGNFLDQDGDGIPGEFPDDVLNWTFTIIDAPPTILSTSPAHLDIEVDPNTNITIAFSETMNITSVEEAFSFSGGGNNYNITDGNVTWGILDRTMTFDPSFPLNNGTGYIFKIEGSIAKDLNDNLLDANGDNVTGDDMILYFTTWLEPPAPSVIYGIPADGSTMVNVDTHIQIKFDFRMDPASVEEVFTMTDGIHVYDENDGVFTWSNGYDIMTYQPDEFLNYEEDYTVRLLGTARSYVGIGMDNNGNDNPDGSPVDDFVFSFTTSPEPPRVISTYPENGAYGVLVTLDMISIVFDSSMDNDTVEDAIRITPHIQSNMTWDASNKELSIQPLGPLLFYTEYTITINGNVATDEAGVLLDGNGDGAYGDDFQFRFVTEGAPDTQPPRIASIFPPNNMTSIPVNIYIQVSFNESMNRTTVEKSFSMSNNTAYINGSFVWNSQGNTFRYYPSENLSVNMTHVITIGPNAADLAGNKMGISYTWTFITGMGEEEPGDQPIEDFWYYMTVIFILLILSGILYTRNKFLTKELRKARVDNKKLKRHIKKLDPDLKGEEQTDALPDNVKENDGGASDADKQVETEDIKEDVKKDER